MSETPLHDAFETSQPEWTEIEGQRTPARFAGIAEEREAVRTRYGVCDLSYRGLLRFTGKDRQTFLQGMVSNDTRLLEPGVGLYATVLEPKGHMLGDMTFFAFDEFYLADTEPGMAQKLHRQLDRFIIREKVTATVETSLAQIGVSGPASSEMLASLFPTFNALQGPFGCATAMLGDQEVFILRRDFTGEDSYLLCIPKELAAEAWTALINAGAAPFGLEMLETLRVEAGIPKYGVDMTDTIPLEAGLDFGIGREKGCYVGQEIIERIISRGRTNRRLVPLSFTGNPLPAVGASLSYEGKEIGRITSIVASPGSGEALGLGYVRNEARQPGTTLQIVESEGTAEVLARPKFGSGTPPAIVND